MKKIVQIKIAIMLLVMFAGGLVQAQNSPQVFNSIDEVFAQKHRPLPDQTRSVDYTVTNTSTDPAVANSLPWAIAQYNAYTGNDVTVVYFDIPGTDTISGLQQMKITNSNTSGIYIFGLNQSTGNNMTLEVSEPGISGNNLFWVTGSNAGLYINDMTLRGGNMMFGGAVSSTLGAYIFASNVTFKDSKATYGGAVFLASNAYIELSGCSFINNTATAKGNNAYSCYGGTLYINSVIVVSLKRDATRNISDFAFGSGMATIDSSDVGTIEVGVEDIDTGGKALKPFSFILGRTQYRTGIKIGDSKITEFKSIDQHNTGLKNLTYFAKPEADTVGKVTRTGVFAQDTINNMVVDSAQVDLAMDSVNVLSTKWLVKQGKLSVINMPNMTRNSLEANIVMDSLHLEGGTFEHDSTPLKNTYITAKQIKLSQFSSAKGLIPSSLILGTGTNVTKTVSDGNPFIQAGDGTAVTLSGDASVAVPAGETLFDLASGASLIINSPTVVLSGSTSINVDYNYSPAFVSSPILNAPIPTDVGTFLFWNESTNSFDGNSTTNFEQLKGYGVMFSATQSINYVGDLSPLNQSIQLQNSDESNVNEFGWNLVGNPYSSALDFEGITFSGIDNVAYTYNKITGRTQVYRQGGFSLNGGTSLIGTGEAFYLRAAQNNASFSIGSGAKVHNIKGLYKPLKTEQKAVSDGNMKITLSDGTNTDQCLIAFESGASMGYVTGEDAIKYFDLNVSEIYTTSGDANLAMNIFDFPIDQPDVTVPLNLKEVTTGSYTLNFENNFAKGEIFSVTLKDLVTNAEVDILQNPTYSFTADGTVERFQLIFHYVTSNVNDININRAISIYPNPSNGIFTIETEDSYNMTITDVSGKVIKQALINNEKSSFDISNNASGVYFIKFQNNEVVKTVKIIKQ